MDEYNFPMVLSFFHSLDIFLLLIPDSVLSSDICHQRNQKFFLLSGIRLQASYSSPCRYSYGSFPCTSSSTEWLLQFRENGSAF